MTTMLAADSGGFDYSNKVFGDEPAIDVDARRWGSLRIRRCLRSLREVSGSVLEVGCGAGRVLRTVHRYRPELPLWGCDLSEPALERARREVPTGVFQKCDASSLTYADGQFAAVVVMDLLEHVVDVRAVLLEVGRVLRPGGILHVHVPCEGEWGSLYHFWLRRGIDITREAVGHVHHFRRSEVIDLLKNTGFSIARTRNSMYPLTQLHDMVGWHGRLSTYDSAEFGSPLAHIKSADAERAGRVLPLSPLRRGIWKAMSAIAPSVLYWETVLLGWQPLGGIGLCVTARKAG